MSHGRFALLLSAAAAVSLAACSHESPTGVGARDPNAPVAHDGLSASTAESEGVSRSQLDQLVTDAVAHENGVPYGAGELMIRAIDMAKVGQVILDGGTWNGKQVIAPDWIAQSEAISSSYEPEYGLLWWRDATPTSYALTNDLLDQWEGNGVAKSITDKLRASAGTSFTTYPEYQTFLRSMITEADRAAINTVLATGDHVPATRIASAAPAVGYYFAGWLGQFMYVIPSKNSVAVRMRRSTAADYTNTAEVNGFPGFLADVYRLVP